MKGRKAKELEDAELEYDIEMTKFYAKGKPDTPGWRKLFAENGINEFTAKDGRIYPDWAIEKLAELRRKHPDKF